MASPQPINSDPAAFLDDLDGLDLPGLDLPSLDDIILHHDAADSSISGMSDSATAAEVPHAHPPSFAWPTPTQALGFCHPALLDDSAPDEDIILTDPDCPAGQAHQAHKQDAAAAAEHSEDHHQKQDNADPTHQLGHASPMSSQHASNQQAEMPASTSPQLLSVPDFIQNVSDRQQLAFSTGPSHVEGAEATSQPRQTAGLPGSTPGQVLSAPQQVSNAARVTFKVSPPGSPWAESGDLSAADAFPQVRRVSPEPESVLKAGRKRARPRVSSASASPQVAANQGQTCGKSGNMFLPQQCSDTMAGAAGSGPKEVGASNCSDSSHRNDGPGQPEEDEAKREVRRCIEHMI